jgi:hypothetical protein
MAILRIYHDSRALGQCRSCRAPIEWAELTTHARHPFDAPIRIVRSQASLVDGRVIDDVDTAVSPTHFATCPHAKAWRARPTGGRLNPSPTGGGRANR